MCKLADDDDDV